MRFRSFCLFHTGQSLLVDFGLCVSTRLVFFTLVSRYWWTLACALPCLVFFDIGFCRSKDLQLYLLYVQKHTSLCIVGPKTYNFMFCVFKDLLLYVL